MGGTGGYARPVEPTDGRISTWRAHTNRGIPSSEPGVDYFCPIGTPIRAAASGVVVDVGTSIMPATGRYITVDLDDGRRVRYLHILRHEVGVGARVRWGEHIADSGATGYGEADWSWNVAGTGGAHVHMTLWAHQRYVFGRYSTLDPEQYMAAHQGGGNSLEDDLSAEAEKKINAIHDAIFSGGNSMKDNKRSISASLADIVEQVKPIRRSSGLVSLRQEIANANNRLVGLEAALKAIAVANGADPDAILKAVQDGVENAMRKVTFSADVDG